MLTSLFSLFYVTGECHRFLHRGWARKKQKPIKIDDKSKDGWQVVTEYELDELASGSEDEKRLKKAREAACRKRRQKDQLASDRRNKPRISMGPGNQLSRGKN